MTVASHDGITAVMPHGHDGCNCCRVVVIGANGAVSSLSRPAGVVKFLAAREPSLAAVGTVCTATFLPKATSDSLITYNQSIYW